MAKYHINSRGEPGVCHAQHQCPFGDIQLEHYGSASEARQAYERLMTGLEHDMQRVDNSSFSSEELNDRIIRETIDQFIDEATSHPEEDILTTRTHFENALSEIELELAALEGSPASESVREGLELHAQNLRDNLRQMDVDQALTDLLPGYVDPMQRQAPSQEEELLILSDCIQMLEQSARRKGDFELNITTRDITQQDKKNLATVLFNRQVQVSSNSAPIKGRVEMSSPEGMTIATHSNHTTLPFDSIQSVTLFLED